MSPMKQIPVKDCSVFDPVFSAGEKDVLRELGLTVLSENEVSRLQILNLILDNRHNGLTNSSQL